MKVLFFLAIIFFVGMGAINTQLIAKGLLEIGFGSIRSAERFYNENQEDLYRPAPPTAEGGQQ